MSKFSTKSVPASKKIVRNRAGGAAYALSDKQALVTITLTSFLKDQFYRTEAQTCAEIQNLVDKLPAEFVAKLALYARKEFGMRSVSHYLAALLAEDVSGTQWGKHFYNAIVDRPDDMAEICAAYFNINGGEKTITNAMKKGFATAFGRLTPYQIAKYKMDGKEVSLIDVLRMCHPKQTDVNAGALTDLVKGTLASFDTWESELSAAGNSDDKVTAKADAWTKLVRERKIGYLALLRNLRNINTQAPNVLPDALEMLTDEKLIKRSRVFPFQYWTAFKEMETEANGTKICKALGTAATIAVDNIPDMAGDTLVVLDVSGSMTTRNMRSTTPAEIGSLFAAALCKKLDADFITFDGSARYVNTDFSGSVLSAAKGIKFPGGSTNFTAIFSTAKKAYDRIFILSDMQGWAERPHWSSKSTQSPLQNAFTEWKKKYNCNPMLYSFDLAGYGTAKFPGNKVCLMSGFSDKMFNLLPALESSPDALLKAVDAVQLS